MKEITSIDINKETVEHANKKYGNFFVLFDGKKIPFEDNSFDTVISFQVIEHIKDDKKYLEEISRVLNKGGFFIFTTPNREKRLKPKQKPFNRFHIREYSGKDLELLLKDFFTFQVFGVFGKKAVDQIEFNRIKKLQKINSLDPLGLRNILPERMKIIVVEVLKSLFSSLEKNNKTFQNNFKEKYSLSDFYLSKENISTAMDFFVVCKKQ